MGWSQVITLTTLVVGAMAITVTCSSPFVQQKLDKVGKLPGQSFDIKFQHYSGYVTVNEEAGRALFYWFMEADQDPQTKPLLLWLNGGPGCSSIAYGEAEEIGPFHINPDGKTLYLNSYSWNQGHYVPQLSQAILKYNSETKKNAINLKGYLVGNALTDDFHDHLGVAQFMWASGLISDQTYKLLNQCDSESFVHPSNSCGQVFENADVELGNIDPYSIFTSLCPGNVSQTKQLLRRKHRFGRLNEGYDPCTEKHSTAYFNLPEVQKALHVDQDHKPSKWETCSEAVNINWKDSPSTVLDVYHELIGSGLRIWMFSGDTDSVIPVTSTRYSIDALKLPTVSPWRPWYDEGKVGGWTQEYDGLTFVAVRGAGHEVPLHRPKLALSLFKAFIAGTSMPTLQLVSDS
ncbi:serine carboxypeptidase-like 29 isoform X3 [Arachis hypogaea]|uniref:serine carboxypeptidase-like 29 isoform X3 n=1 Tax=Arachis hypogaea TaxID=3818 RepID=UPI000DEC2A1E